MACASPPRQNPLRSARCRSKPPSRHHARLLTPGPPLDFRQRARERDEIGERALRCLSEIARLRLVALDIDAQRRASSAGARKAIDDARAALEHNAYALRPGVGPI